MEVIAMDELKKLKQIVDTHRLMNPRKKKFPDHFWPRVIKLSQTVPSDEIAEFLKINKGNINRRIRESTRSELDLAPIGPNQFLQIPIESNRKESKQIVISLPHNITLRIDL